MKSWHTYNAFRCSIMTKQSDYIWNSFDINGVECCISRLQWEQHVYKRPDISQCLSLTIQAMQRVDLEKPDRRRPDENGRRFRFVDIVDPTMVGYILRVSIKYVRQNDGLWIKFYQSCWHQRSL